MTNSITSNDLHQLLINSGVIGCSGYMSITLNNIPATIKGLDAMGHLVQEWLFTWAKVHNVHIHQNPKTQEFPDYFLNPNDVTKDLLEIKVFNHFAGPAFDLADFFEYIDFLATKPYKLYADYLVLSYAMDEASGMVTIKNIWLKKIWELAGYSPTNYITCQIRTDKQSGLRRPYKIRPTSFNKSGNTFSGPKDFLTELQNLLNANDITEGRYVNWLKEVDDSHMNYYGQPIK